ncbi:MAG: hypothetical protein Q8R67_06290 [Rhodoferax sp.]|nr:GspMb/PilO family protein [Rhodoferax sp.]MDP3651274.1 hypothetical protein [Rhodoferax sp.]
MKSSNLALPPFPILVALSLVAMLGLQGFVEYGLLAPLAADTAKLGDDIQGLRIKSAFEPPSVPKTQAQLDDILSRLHAPDATTARIERLHQIANAYGVVLRKASYQSQTVPGAIVRHEMTADLGGSYPAIRQFLRALLAEDQAVAVEALEFSRPGGSVGNAGSAGSSAVRAQVRMALYSRSTAP